MNKQDKENKTKFRLPANTYLTYLLLVTLILTGVTFSKYVASNSTGDSSRVASFDVGTTQLVLVSSDNVLESATEDEVVYTFDINNTSEVALRYTVGITGYDNSLTCEVTPSTGQLAVQGSQTVRVRFTLSDPSTAQMSVSDNINVNVTAEQIR